MAAIISRKKIVIVHLRLAVDQLQKSLSPAKKFQPNYSYPEYEERAESLSVPKDVKEGHFAVIAIGDGKSKRHIVSLSYLTHPAFRMLLDKSAEEYGFDHESALTIACRSSELETILSQQWNM